MYGHTIERTQGLCMILALGLITSAANTATAQATSVPVGNFSFEIEGGDPGNGDWRMLPGTYWVDGNAGNNYEILQLDVEGTHFKNFIGVDHDNRPGPGGVNVLNLSGASTAATAMTQDLGYSIGAGDLVAVSYVLGDSEDAGDNPGNVEVSILVGGTSNAAVTVANDAGDGDFKAFKSVLTATSSGNLSIGFKNKTNVNWLELVEVVVLSANDADAGYIPIGNFSFETESSASGDAGWYHLPGIGSWTKAETNEHQILDLSVDSTLFPSLNLGPEGLNVLNLANADTITHDTGYSVSTTDKVLLDFSLGDSATEDPGDVSVSLLIDGIERSRRAIANTAPDGSFTNLQTAFTATTSGMLSIRLKNRSGVNWLDDVNVRIMPQGAHAPCIQGSVDISGWSSVLHHDWWTEGNAAGFGSVSNSLGDSDSDSYGLPIYVDSGNQTYSITWADGAAASDRGTVNLAPPAGFQYYWGGTASADLYLDLTGARVGSSAEGLTSAGFGGVSFDGSDGAIDGAINFTVSFTITASATDSHVEGLFGIHVDAYSTDLFTVLTDLTPTNTPYVTGSSLETPSNMTYAEKTAGGGDYAWFFTYSADDIAVLGGSVNDTLTAHFAFIPTSDNATIFDDVEITAFALAEGVVVPPGTLLMIR